MITFTSGPFSRRLLSGQSQSAFESAGLEALLHGGEEARRVRAVDDAMVIGQRQIHHRANGDRLAEVRVTDDDRALDDCSRAEDGDLWLIDDRGVEQRAAATGVGQREGSATELVRAHLV